MYIQIYKLEVSLQIYTYIYKDEFKTDNTHINIAINFFCYQQT